MISEATVQNAHHSPLKAFCRCFVELERKTRLEDADFPEGAGVVKSASERVLRTCKCLLALMDPGYKVLGTTTEDALVFSEFVEAEDASNISFEKPISQSLASSPFWQSQMDEVIKYGASSAQQEGTLDSVLALLEASKDSDCVDEALKVSVGACDLLQASFRPGALLTFLTYLKQRVLRVVPATMVLDAKALDAESIATLQTGLEYLVSATKSKALTDLQLRFTEWKGSVAGELAVKRLQDFAHKNMGLDDLVDFDALSELLDQNVEATFPQEVVTDLKRLCVKIFKDLQNRVTLTNMGILEFGF